MSWLQKTGLALLLLLVLLIIALIGLVSTQSGLHFLINNGVRLVSGLNIGQIQGGWQDLELSDIRYTSPGIHFTLNKLDLSLSPSCIFSSKVCVNLVSADTLDLEINTNELPPSKPSKPLKSISTPYPIILNSFLLNNVEIKIDGTQLILSQLTTGAVWRKDLLQLTSTKIEGVEVNLPANPPVVALQKADLRNQTPLGQQLKQLFSKPLLNNLHDFILPLGVEAPDLKVRDISISNGTPITVTQLLLNIKAIKQQIEVQKLSIEMPQGTLLAQGSLTTVGEWPLNLNIKTGLTDNIQSTLLGQTMDLVATGGLKKALHLQVITKGTVNAELNAVTHLNQAGLPLNVRLTSKQLQWPLTGQAQYYLQNLVLNIKGKAVNYTADMKGSLKGEQIPAMEVTLNGQGNEQNFKLQQMLLTALKGTVELTGIIDWSKALSWQSKLAINNIDASQQWRAWPVKLNGLFTTRGSLYGGNWQIAVPNLNISGTVNNNIINLTGTAKTDASNQLQIADLKMQLGNNYLTANGNIGNKLDLDVNINAPHLEGYLPQLAGSAQGYLKLKGSYSNPIILADMVGQSIRWAQYQIGDFKLNSDIQGLNRSDNRATLSLQKLTNNSVYIQQLQLALSGSKQKHHLDLTMQGKPIDLDLDLEGSLTNNNLQWHGVLQQAKLGTEVGPWHLINPVRLDYLVDQQTLKAAPHCWNNPNAEVCITKPMSLGKQGTVNVVLKYLNVAMLQPFLQDNTDIKGNISGQSDIQWYADNQNPKATLVLDGKNMEITPLINSQVLPIKLSAFHLDSKMAQGKASANWRVGMLNNGQFNGQVQIDDLAKRRTLSGKIQATNFSLRIFQPLLLGQDRIEGLLNSNLRLAGNLQQPTLFGDINLTQLRAIGDFLPIDITDGRLSLKFLGERSIAEGNIQTSQGHLTLHGNANWQNMSDWRADLSAKGDKIRVTLPPMLQLDVSPNIVVQALPNQLRLAGEIDIPWARITVKDLPEDAVKISRDEVIVNSSLQSVKKNSDDIKINSNLTINVGDDVKLEAFGLKSGLKGKLKVIQDNRGLGLHGKINLESGEFRAYGQDLLIRKGTLLFSGPPSQPLFDIEAIRNPNITADNVVVGVRVSGIADEPRLTLFSEPGMSQQDMISYLLRGEGLDAGSDDNGMVASALIGLGLAKSGKVIGKVGEAFGIQGLSLDATGVGDSSQVEVSGYVFPGLQVKYGVGIFDSLATLTLRYRLMPKLYLQAVSGVDQALDLLYQFEF